MGVRRGAMNRITWRSTGRPSWQPPDQPYAGEGARARLVSALTMEEVLVRPPPGCVSTSCMQASLYSMTCWPSSMRTRKSTSMSPASSSSCHGLSLIVISSASWRPGFGTE